MVSGTTASREQLYRSPGGSQSFSFEGFASAGLSATAPPPPGADSLGLARASAPSASGVGEQLTRVPLASGEQGLAQVTLRCVLSALCGTSKSPYIDPRVLTSLENGRIYQLWAVSLQWLALSPQLSQRPADTTFLPGPAACSLEPVGGLPSSGAQARRPSGGRLPPPPSPCRQDTGAQRESSGLIPGAADPKSRKTSEVRVTQQPGASRLPALDPCPPLLPLHNRRRLEPPSGGWQRLAEWACVIWAQGSVHTTVTFSLSL